MEEIKQESLSSLKIEDHPERESDIEPDTVYVSYKDVKELSGEIHPRINFRLVKNIGKYTYNFELSDMSGGYYYMEFYTDQYMDAMVKLKPNEIRELFNAIKSMIEEIIKNGCRMEKINFTGLSSNFTDTEIEDCKQKLLAKNPSQEKKVQNLLSSNDPSIIFEIYQEEFGEAYPVIKYSDQAVKKRNHIFLTQIKRLQRFFPGLKVEKNSEGIGYDIILDRVKRVEN
jgi:hypothetical protein